MSTFQFVIWLEHWMVIVQLTEDLTTVNYAVKIIENISSECKVLTRGIFCGFELIITLVSNVWALISLFLVKVIRQLKQLQFQAKFVYIGVRITTSPLLKKGNPLAEVTTDVSVAESLSIQ